MCLNLRKDYHKPYNKSNIRWKLGIFDKEELTSFYRKQKYEKNEWMVAFNTCDLNLFKKYETEWGINYVSNWRTKYGFHTFLDKKSIKVVKSGAVILKLDCQDFIASGTFFGKKSETWRKMRIIEIYDRNGKSIWKLNNK